MFWLAEVFNGSYSEQEMKRMERWAHRQRAEMVHDLLSASGRGLAAALRGAGQAVRAASGGLVAGYGGYRRWQRKRTAIRELSALSDHTLKDIGLERGNIRAVVEGLIDGKRDRRVNLRPVESRPGDRARVSGADGTETGHDRQRAA